MQLEELARHCHDPTEVNGEAMCECIRYGQDTGTRGLVLKSTGIERSKALSSSFVVIWTQIMQLIQKAGGVQCAQWCI
jgi:hypothetical protein